MLLWVEAVVFPLGLALDTFLGGFTLQQGSRGNIICTIIYIVALTFICAIICAGLFEIVRQLYNILLSHSGGCGGIFLPELFLGTF